VRDELGPEVEVETHLEPLQGNSLAGKRMLGDDPRNLWPEPHTVGRDQGSVAKDKVENKLKRAVCNGTMSLADAQHTIATDWRKAQQ